MTDMCVNSGPFPYVTFHQEQWLRVLGKVVEETSLNFKSTVLAEWQLFLCLCKMGIVGVRKKEMIPSAVLVQWNLEESLSSDIWKVWKVEWLRLSQCWLWGPTQCGHWRGMCPRNQWTVDPGPHMPCRSDYALLQSPLVGPGCLRLVRISSKRHRTTLIAKKGAQTTASLVKQSRWVQYTFTQEQNGVPCIS